MGLPPRNSGIIGEQHMRRVHHRVNGVQTRVEKVERAISPRALRTGFPTSTIDGAEFTFQVTEGVNWRFRYNASSASSYKWEFIGGPFWIDTETSLSQVISTTTPTDLTNVSLTLPSALGAGDYQLQGCARFTNATNAHTVTMNGKVGSVTTGSAVSLDRGVTAGADARGSLTLTPEDYAGVAASGAATLQISLNAATASVTLASASIAIIPKRVAGA